MARMIMLAPESNLSNQDGSGAVQWCDPAHPRLPFCVIAKPQQSITAPDPPPLTIGAQPGGHTSQWITEPRAHGGTVTIVRQAPPDAAFIKHAPTFTITVPAGSVATFPGGQLTGPVTIEIRPATPPAPR